MNCLSSINVKVSFSVDVSRLSVLHTFSKNFNFVSAYDNFTVSQPNSSVTAYDNFTVSQPNSKVLFELIMARHGLLKINILLLGEVINLIQDRYYFIFNM